MLVCEDEVYAVFFKNSESVSVQLKFLHTRGKSFSLLSFK